MQNPIIVALDVPSLNDVKDFITQFHDEPLFVKVGMELFYQEGPSIIEFLKENNHSIFLDLKLHDIPNTVKSAMTGMARYEIDIVNVHAAGGTKMMEAAIEGLDIGTRVGKKRPSCIAVTQLTSTSEEMMQKELLINESIEDSVLHFAALARQSGLDGVVCSTLEVPKIREKLGKEFMTVTPGIREASNAWNDQVRVATPQEARKLGSTAIVVGRNITASKDPWAAYKRIKSDWEGVQL